MKWCNGVTKYSFALVWCYGKMNMVQWYREYTQVHMVKWWNTVLKWCNNKDLHIIMVKWCNKYGEMVQIINTSSHGEILKHASRYILFAKCQNGETVILTFTSPIFHESLQQWVPSSFLYCVGCCICRLWLVSPWSYNCLTTWSNAFQCRIPPLILINTFLL